MLREVLQGHFYGIQIGLGIAFAVIAWFALRGRGPESNFRVYEADRPKTTGAKSGRDLGQDRLKTQRPLALTGIRIDGAPHEILGVPANAKPEVIQKAYRDLMKRYHPDTVGRPGTREWQDAQKIAEALNRAKEALLKTGTKS